MRGQKLEPGRAGGANALVHAVGGPAQVGDLEPRGDEERVRRIAGSDPALEARERHHGRGVDGARDFQRHAAAERMPDDDESLGAHAEFLFQVANHGERRACFPWGRHRGMEAAGGPRGRAPGMVAAAGEIHQEDVAACCGEHFCKMQQVAPVGPVTVQEQEMHARLAALRLHALDGGVLDAEGLEAELPAQVSQSPDGAGGPGEKNQEQRQQPSAEAARRPGGGVRIAGCSHECRRGGVSVKKIVSRAELIIRRREWKDNGRRVVFTNGCFDLLHAGHVRLLEQARALGEALVVGLNSDRSVRQLKGDARPLVPEAERAEVLAALAAVDAVTIFGEPTPRELIAALLPDVLVKGGDWGPDQIVGREEVEAAGGRVVVVPYLEGYSTSAFIAKIAGKK